MMLSSGRVCVGRGITASQRARQNRKPNRIRAENAGIFVHAATRRRGEDAIGDFAALFSPNSARPARLSFIFYLRSFAWTLQRRSHVPRLRPRGGAFRSGLVQAAGGTGGGAGGG